MKFVSQPSCLYQLHHLILLCCISIILRHQELYFFRTSEINEFYIKCIFPFIIVNLVYWNLAFLCVLPVLKESLTLISKCAFCTHLVFRDMPVLSFLIFTSRHFISYLKKLRKLMLRKLIFISHVLSKEIWVDSKAFRHIAGIIIVWVASSCWVFLVSFSLLIIDFTHINLFLLSLLIKVFVNSPHRKPFQLSAHSWFHAWIQHLFVFEYIFISIQMDLDNCESAHI